MAAGDRAPSDLLALERRDDPRFGCGADSRHVEQAPACRCCAELRDGRDPERGRDGDGALRSDAEHATERRKLERRRPPQLRELGDLAGLDQLEKTRFDARADALQLPDAAGPHHCCDVDRRSTHAFGCTTVRAGAVVAGVGKLEQRREFIQPGRDTFVADLLALAHACRVSRAACPEVMSPCARRVARLPVVEVKHNQ